MAERMDFLQETFHKLFGKGGPLALSRAPGRVNLIGEHTDYNDGYVLPIAVDRDIRILFRATGRRTVELYAANFEQKGSFDLHDCEPHEGLPWLRYPLGVAKLLCEAGQRLSGLQGVVQGTIPVGGGMSSSAALCVASAFALLHAAGLSMDRLEIARLCQQAEHRFAGVKCGIMDQYVSLFADAGQAVLLDCRELSHQLVPMLSDDVRLLVFDTGVKHALASSAYNERRAECDRAVKLLRNSYPEIRALRDVSVDQFLDVKSTLPDPIRQRAHHVITENARTLAAARALRKNNPVQLGVLMAASHESLRDDYQVSCAELDALVDVASGFQGEYGSRMTGGGFGGCAITLVDADKVEQFSSEVPKLYRQRTGLDTAAYVASAHSGAEVADM